MSKYFKERAAKATRLKIRAILSEDNAAALAWFRDNNKFENLEIILDELRHEVIKPLVAEEALATSKNENDFIVAWVQKKIRNHDSRIADLGPSEYLPPYLELKAKNIAQEDLGRVTSLLSPDNLIAILSQVKMPDYALRGIKRPFTEEVDRSAIIRNTPDLLERLLPENRFYFATTILGDETHLSDESMKKVLGSLRSSDRSLFINYRLKSPKTENISFDNLRKLHSLMDGTSPDEERYDKQMTTTSWLEKDKKNNFDFGFLRSLIEPMPSDSLITTWLKQNEENNFNWKFLERLGSRSRHLYNAWLNKRENNNETNFRAIVTKFSSEKFASDAYRDDLTYDSPGFTYIVKFTDIVKIYLSDKANEEKGQILVRNADLFKVAEDRFRAAGEENRKTNSYAPSADRVAKLSRDQINSMLKAAINPKAAASFAPYLFKFCEACYGEDEKAKVNFIESAITCGVIVPMRDGLSLKTFIAAHTESSKSLKKLLVEVEVENWVKSPPATPHTEIGGGGGGGGSGGNPTPSPHTEIGGGGIDSGEVVVFENPLALQSRKARVQRMIGVGPDKSKN